MSPYRGFESHPLRFTPMKKLSSVIRIILTILAFYFILRRTHPYKILSLIAHINPITYIAAIVLSFIAILFQTMRWKYFLNNETPFFKLLKIYLVSFFMGNFLPSGGLDVVRGYYLGKDMKDYEGNFAVVVMDRLTGFIAVSVLSLIAVAIGFNLPTNFRLVILVAALFLISLLFISFNKYFYRVVREWMLFVKIFNIGERFAKFYDSYFEFRSSMDRVAVGILISFLIQFSYAISAYMSMKSIGFSYPFYKFLFFVPLINMIAMIPITISGLGLREGGFVALFQTGLTREGAVLTSLLYYFSSLIASLAGGIILLFGKV